MTKDEIIAAIRETALANGGVPLGRARLFKETGIAEHHFLKFGTLGQLQIEAGFEPNTLTEASPEDLLINQLVALTCQVNQFPTEQQIRQARHESPEKFSSHNTYRRLGSSKAERAFRIANSLMTKSELTEDEEKALQIIAPLAETYEAQSDESSPKMNTCGFVYLLRDGTAYKIGKSINPDTRRDDLQTGNPRRITLVHCISTDDPSGIEAYWHNRFSKKQKVIQGGEEWFHLSQGDVRDFRSRIRM